MTKIETGSFYRVEKVGIVRVIAQGYGRSSDWVRFETMQGREMKEHFSEATKHWTRA